MESVWLILTAIVLLSFSGVPACLLPTTSQAGQRLSCLLMVMGSAFGLWGVANAFGDAGSASVNTPWFLPWGQFAVRADPLSALFLVPVFIVPALGSIYGLGYWKQSEHPENGRWLGFFYGLLAGSMAMVVIARDGVLFLMAWEIMALSAYFALVTEEDNAEVRRVGWVYLVAAHMGTLCLFAMFALWWNATGSFALEPESSIPANLAGAIFVLALIGFSFKAGLFPLHFWLPGAHANAPSHVSAVMSGVLLKMGVYGIVRMTALLPEPPLWWGETLLAVGACTGLLGIAFAMSQHDFKRMLAYSSVENVGIIAMGLGLAVLGRSLGQREWILLGLSGALLHVWNHSLFKSLLFLNAGALLHATQTREMDRLGGLAKQMPLTMGLFTVGAVAICALPPMNGFSSEWLLYMGLFRTMGLGGDANVPVAAVAAVALATIGALAVVCFVKLFGAVFLGSARGDGVLHAHDPQPNMIFPMVLLASGCILIGLFPLITVPLLLKAVQTWANLPEIEMAAVTTIAPMEWISTLGLTSILIIGLFILVLRIMLRNKSVPKAGTWGCGYAQPTSRIQYSGASFGRTIVELFSFAVWPKDRQPAIHGLFPAKAFFKRIVPDLILDRLVRPLFYLAGRNLPRLRVFQQGQIQLYVLYIVMILLLLLSWGALRV